MEVSKSNIGNTMTWLWNNTLVGQKRISINWNAGLMDFLLVDDKACSAKLVVHRHAIFGDFMGKRGSMAKKS